MKNNDEGKRDLTSAVDKRDWLVSQGLAKPGRGKFSNAAKEALVAAAENGIVFIDKSVSVGTVRTVVDGEIVEEKRELNPFAHHPEPIREGMVTFNGTDGFTLEVNSSEACNSCRYSLGWCYCKVPTFTYWKTGEVLTFGGNV